MTEQNYHAITIGYIGEPTSIARAVQDNPEVMKKIEATATEQGCVLSLAVEGDELCGSTNLFGFSVWSDPENARKFYQNDPNVAILARKAGITRFTTKPYRVLSGNEGAFQTEKMRGLTELVGAGAR